AIRQYETLLARGSSEPVVLNNLAALYEQVGDSRAIATARRAYEISSSSADIADTYGWLLVQSGQRKAGLKVLEPAAASADAKNDVKLHYTRRSEEHTSELQSPDHLV